MKRPAETLGLATLGLAGGWVAKLAGVPMPFLIGSLGAVAMLVILADKHHARGFAFPEPLRRAFVGVIGALIGATFSPELLTLLPRLWSTLLAIVVFVGLSHWLVFQLYLRVGGYDRTTALFASTPGGLIESVTIGERAGGDVRILTLQHFARIVLVVVSVPLLFLILSGEKVGSAAGQSLPQKASSYGDIAVILVLTAIGLGLGPRLRLPAAHLTGPLVLSAMVHVTGLTTATGPQSLLNLAQVVVGTGLGVMFAGTTLRHLLRAFSLGATAVAVTLGLAALFALALHPISGLETQALFLSFAPGGVTEMGLIALSLGISPVVVAVNHLFRISVTVAIAARLGRRINPDT